MPATPVLSSENRFVPVESSQIINTLHLLLSKSIVVTTGQMPFCSNNFLDIDNFLLKQGYILKVIK
jgi:hypothetical protein